MLALSVEHQKKLRELQGTTQIDAKRFERIFSQGDAPDFVYLVESGLVKISISAARKKEIVLGLTATGGLFGLTGVLCEAARVYNATALTKARIFVIPKAAFLRYCEVQTECWRYLAEGFAREQMHLHLKIQLLVLHDVQHRLINFLLELAELCGLDEATGSVYSIPLSQEDLAVVIGATRETTSNKLNALARQRLVLLGRKRIIIPSLEALRNRLGGRVATTLEA